MTLFDTADVYSDGASEEVLGAALSGRRDRVLISTKTGLPTGGGPNDAGSSRARLIQSVDDALRRLRTDYLDLLQLHAFDAGTPIEEALSTLDDLVRVGKVRYVGVSNFPEPPSGALLRGPRPDRAACRSRRLARVRWTGGRAVCARGDRAEPERDTAVPR